MFQEKDIEAYAAIKAPITLKNRVKQSVVRERKAVARQRIAALSAAACLAIVLLSGSLGSGDAIVLVNDTVVSKEAVQIEAEVEAYGLSMARVRRVLPPVQIPLEIQVKKDAHIRISQGTLQKEIEPDSESDKVTEMELSESTVLYWTVDRDIANLPTCTITAKGKESIYVIEFEEEAGFTIRQIQ